MKMSTLMVLTTKRGFPPDLRVEKETKALLSRGYRVYLVSGGPGKLPEFQVVDGVNVYRTKLLWSRPLLLSIIVNHLILFPQVIGKVVEHRTPVIHVHDLQYALIVAIIGRIFRRKVIYDAHEDYTGMTRGYLERNGVLKKTYFRAFLAYYILSETLVCRLSSRIAVVVQENRNRLIGLKVPADKIVVVSNTPDVNALKRLTVSSQRVAKKIVISYVGGFSYLRGLDILVEALPSIMRKYPETLLVLVGNGGDYFANLVSLSKKLEVEKKVTFTGWVSFDKAMEYIQKSDIGVIPHRSGPHTNSTVPHKLFQYMFYRKPVIVSDVKPLKRIVTETGCGLVFHAGDNEDLAEKILELIEDASKQSEMGEKGRSAVETKYNWDVEQKELLSMYEKLVSS